MEDKIVVVNPKITEFEQWVKDYRNLIVTEANYKEMNEKRLEIFRKRTAFKNDMDDVIAKASKILKDVEDDINNKLKAIDKIKADKELVEKNRVAAHKSAIAGVNDRVLKVAAINNVLDVKILQGKYVEWKSGYKAEEFNLEFDMACQTLDIAIADRIEFLEMKAKQALESVKEDTAINNMLTETKVAPPSNIPSPLKENVRTDIFTPEVKISAPVNTTVPVFGEEEKKVSEFMDKAKNGDFSIGVAVNFEYLGFRFYIDGNLPDKDQKAIVKFIGDIVDNQEF